LHSTRGKCLRITIFLLLLAGAACTRCLAANETNAETTAVANGYTDWRAPTPLTPGANVDADLPLQPDADPSPQAVAAPPPAAAAPTPQRGFFTRLGHAYLDDWTVDSNGSPAAPEPARRGTPRPLNSPPFPGADWPIGGTVEIGAPDYNTYILMQAINENKGRIKIYGWFDIGGNASTSNKGRYANGPTAYDVIPNSIQLDQVALYFERLPNTVQKEHFDWGFRFTNLYGLDYRYTTAWTIATLRPRASSASSCSVATMSTVMTQ
jgi:hypothetical protein